jgi:hypothetical protein
MRKVLWMLFGLLTIALLYYLFIRSFEFEVRFKANTSPGDLIETIRIWNRSLDNSKIVEVDSFRVLNQSIIRENRRYVYNWLFTSKNDSVTKVNVQITEPGRTMINKLLIPFTDQVIERDASDITNEFYDILKEHLKITRVKLIGEVELDSSFCACTYLETLQIEKASGMMNDYPLLTSFVARFDLKTDGPPSVRIREWNHNIGHLKFDFCFPIVPSDSLPLNDEIVYKKFGRVRTLKAEYYGNYITSDRAWYELLQYAKKNGYKVNGLPIEYFHNNPTLGVNEREWKADVYLPIE